MKNNWFDTRKKKIKQFYLRETGTKDQLEGWIFLMVVVLLLLFKQANHTIKEAPQNKIRVEKTGYFENIYYGHREIVIVLMNGERYSIYGPMYYYSDAFNKRDFFDEVKKGDELHFVIWDDDERKYPVIYQLECNNKEYLSYKKAIRVIYKENAFLLTVCILAFLLCCSFSVVALFRYVKAKHNREKCL